MNSDLPFSARKLLEVISTPLLILDTNLHIITGNEAFYQTFQVSQSNEDARFLDELPIIGSYRSALEKVILDGVPLHLEIEHTFPSIGYKSLLLHPRLIFEEGKTTPFVALVFEDNTLSKKSENRFRSLLTCPDATVIVDEQGKIVLVNAQAEKLFGYKREELLSQSIEILIPDRYRHSHELQRLGYIDNPHVRQMGDVMELYALRKDGTECPVEVSFSPLDTDEGLLVSSTIRDITMRKQAEEDLRVALAKEKELIS